MKINILIALLCSMSQTEAMQKTFDNNDTLNQNVTIKKSRKKIMEAVFQPKVKLGPNA